VVFLTFNHHNQHFKQYNHPPHHRWRRLHNTVYDGEPTLEGFQKIHVLLDPEDWKKGEYEELTQSHLRRLEATGRTLDEQHLWTCGGGETMTQAHHPRKRLYFCRDLLDVGGEEEGWLLVFYGGG